MEELSKEATQVLANSALVILADRAGGIIEISEEEYQSILKKDAKIIITRQSPGLGIIIKIVNWNWDEWEDELGKATG